MMRWPCAPSRVDGGPTRNEPVQRQIAANKEDDKGSDRVSCLLTDRDLATGVLDFWKDSNRYPSKIAQL